MKTDNLFLTFYEKNEVVFFNFDKILKFYRVNVSIKQNDKSKLLNGHLNG